MLVAFEVAEVGLQGEGCQQEVGLLPLDALREEHLLPQVPVVVVPGHAIAAGRAGTEIIKNENIVSWAVKRFI